MGLSKMVTLVLVLTVAEEAKSMAIIVQQTTQHTTTPMKGTRLCFG